MYEYYAEQSVQPTFADFKGDTDLARYEKLRKEMFARLRLSPKVFAGSDILEFGPDTGENALVFARWGAQMTLVEPNAEAHPYIRRYFANFSLEALLKDIDGASLLDYRSEHKFDAIDAEGFIYTVQPTSAWVSKAASLLRSEGLFIISYMELYGSFMELLLKSIYHTAVRLGVGSDGIETVRLLYQPKWDSISHTRTIESWYMDVITNPFVRRRFFLDAVDLIEETRKCGMRLYSSWPNYHDMLKIQWIKSPYSKQSETASTRDFIEQSRLSHFLGSKCFLVKPNNEIVFALAELIAIADRLVDDGDVTACANARSILDSIMSFISPATVVASTREQEQAHSIIAMIARIFELIEAGDGEKLVEFCREDKTFISTWGMPNHYAVFQQEANTGVDSR